MDEHAWDARYGEADLVWSAGPNQFVVQHTQGLTPGTAFDVACGEGRNALWLAEQGWDVVGVDFSAVGIDKARRIAARRGVDVEFRVGDVTDDGTVTGSFDLVLVAYLHLPDDTMGRVLHALVGHVAPDGTMLVIGHHVDNLDRGHGGPPDRTVLHDPSRIAQHLAGLEIVSASEADREVETDDGPRTAVDSVVVARRRG